MSDRRRAARVVIPERPAGTLCVLQDVVLESATPRELVLLASAPVPRGVDLMIHVEHDDGCRRTFCARVTGRRPVLVDTRLHHRVTLAVVRPSAQADSAVPDSGPQRVHGPVPAAVVRRIEVQLEDIGTTGCLLRSLTPLEVGTDGTLELRHDGVLYGDAVRICWSTAVAGAGAHRFGGRFVPLAPPSPGSVRRFADSLGRPDRGGPAGRTLSVVTRVLGALLLTIAVCGGPAVAHAQSRPVEARARATAGWAALEARRFGEALEIFTAAAQQRETDPTLAMGAGAASFMLGRNAEAAAWLERALALDPDYIDASILLGELYYTAGRVTEAIATYEVAAAREPGRLPLAQRLQAWRKEARLLSGFQQSRRAHVSVLFEGPASEAIAQRAVEMIEAAYVRVGAMLHAYPTDPVTVVLYTEEQFRDVTRFPTWAAAAYDGRIRVPARGAEQSLDELEAVLSHEFAHAVVAGLGGRAVPVWLNEGLATVFEPGGLEEAAATLSRTSQRVELSSLQEGFSELPSHLVRLAYAQSAQSVAQLLAMVGPSGIVAILKDVASGTAFDEAFEQRVGLPFSTFETFVLR